MRQPVNTAIFTGPSVIQEYELQLYKSTQYLIVDSKILILQIQSTPVNSYPKNSDLRLIRTYLRSLFRDDQGNIIRLIRISHDFKTKIIHFEKYHNVENCKEGGGGSEIF